MCCAHTAFQESFFNGHGEGGWQGITTVGGDGGDLDEGDGDGDSDGDGDFVVVAQCEG